MSGRLYLVATPIGNLADLGGRAREVLGAVDVVYCEDTRVTRKLLEGHGLKADLRTHHAHSSPRSLDAALGRLEQGETAALVSDAGTPLVSDPGLELVRAALERGVEVVPIPGPSAVLTALVGSGLPTQPFIFLGFLPRGRGDAREILAPWLAMRATLVMYEAPPRLLGTLTLLEEMAGSDRPACVARELTKRFETFERGTLAQLRARFETPPKGEIVLVVGPSTMSSEPAVASERLREQAEQLIAGGMKPSEAAKVLAGAHGVTKRAAYAMVLEVGRASDDDPNSGA